MTEYLTGTVPLEDVWDTLNEAHQLELVNAVVQVLGKLQKLDLSKVGQSLARYAIQFDWRFFSTAPQGRNWRSRPWVLFEHQRLSRRTRRRQRSDNKGLQLAGDKERRYPPVSIRRHRQD